MIDKPEHVDQLEQIRSFAGRDGNLCIWGKLYGSRTGRTVGGWLVDSWSEHGGPPYWQAKLHWFDKAENKLCNVYLKMGYGESSMNLHGEDTEVDPKRASFVRKMVNKWELEWLRDEAK
jgi:hypothetical protein